MAFPKIPNELAVAIKEQSKWLFSTRELKTLPYFLQHYLQEIGGNPPEYVILGHSGHGINSYAIHYYLVSGPLNLFLQLAWGGVYMDADASASWIRECFSLADEIVPAVRGAERLSAGERLTIVGSDFYGSYWSAPEQGRQKEIANDKNSKEVLTEVLRWLRNPPADRAIQQTGGA